MSQNEQQAPDSTSVEMPNTSPATNESAAEHTNQGQGDYVILKRRLRFDPIAVYFTVVVFSGGLYGLIYSGSIVSFIASTVFVILLAITIYVDGILKIPYPLMAVLLGIAFTMFYRCSLSGNFLPSGLTAVLATIALTRHCYLWYIRRQPQPSVN